MATYSQWSQSYTPKVILTYRGVKYNKTCDSPQSVHYSPHCPWLVLLYKSEGNTLHKMLTKSFISSHYEKNWTANE